MRSVALVLLATLAATCARPERPRPNVLLLTVDTLRADHLGCYGGTAAPTPHIDRLASEGLRFERASTPRAKTSPAIASLLTGLYPHEHGLRDLTQRLDAGLPMLQERLRAGGWATGAILGNYVLTEARAGLRRGFDAWVESLPDVRGVPPHDAPQRTARSLTDAALVALGLLAAPEREASGAPFEPRQAFARAEQPWMLWLHYMDPHGAYAPPDEHRVRAAGADPQPFEVLAAPGQRHPRLVAEYNVPPEARLAEGGFDAAAVRALYAGEVRFIDAEIGRLLDALRAAGRLEDTLVVLTSDHGESLGEHGYYFEHGRYTYESTCRVPLIVRLPASLRGERGAGVRASNVSLVDLAPTLLELFGLEPLRPARGAGPRGAALADELLEGASTPRAVFYEKIERAGVPGVVQAKAVRSGDWKLIWRFSASQPEAGGQPLLLSEELYDLAADPLEARDLAAAPPPGAPLASLRRELRRFTDADGSFAELGTLLERLRQELEREDGEAVRTLESLGY